MEEKKPVPFVWTPRPSQMARTVERLKVLARNPSTRPFVCFDLGEKFLGAVEVVGAEGSFTYAAGVCSHCGKKVALTKVRIEVFAARRDSPPIAFQFGERFCSPRCADAFAQAFIKFGLDFQGLDKKPEKTFVIFEFNASQNWRAN